MLVTTNSQGQPVDIRAAEKDGSAAQQIPLSGAMNPKNLASLTLKISQAQAQPSGVPQPMNALSMAPAPTATAQPGQPQPFGPLLSQPQAQAAEAGAGQATSGYQPVELRPEVQSYLDRIAGGGGAPGWAPMHLFNQPAEGQQGSYYGNALNFTPYNAGDSATAGLPSSGPQAIGGTNVPTGSTATAGKAGSVLGTVGTALAKKGVSKLAGNLLNNVVGGGGSSAIGSAGAGAAMDTISTVPAGIGSTIGGASSVLPAATAAEGLAAPVGTGVGISSAGAAAGGASGAASTATGSVGMLGVPWLVVGLLRAGGGKFLEQGLQSINKRVHGAARGIGKVFGMDDSGAASRNELETAFQQARASGLSDNDVAFTAENGDQWTLGQIKQHSKIMAPFYAARDKELAATGKTGGQAVTAARIARTGGGK